MTPRYRITVKKLKSDHAELEVRCGWAGDAVDLWPVLAARLLADAPGSPLADAPVDDDAWAAEHRPRVELVKRARDGSNALLRVFGPDAWRAPLRRGMTWTSERAPSDRVQALDAAWLPTGKALLVARDNGCATLFAVTKKGLGAARSHLNHQGLRAVDVNPAGDRLLTAGGYRARLWDIVGKRVLEEIAFDQLVTAARFVDDAWLVVGCADGSARLFEILEPEAGRRFDVGAPVTAIAARGRRVAIGCADGGAWILDLAGGDLRDIEALHTSARFDAHPGPVRDVDVMGGRLLTAGDDRALLWPLDGGEPTPLPYAVKRRPYLARPVFSPDASALLFEFEPWVFCMDTATGACQRLGDGIQVTALAFSPDGRLRLAEHYPAPGLSVWDASGALALRRDIPRTSLHRTQTSGRQSTVTFSPDGRWLAAPCQPKDHKKLKLLLIPVQGGGQVERPHPKPDYDFFDDVEFIDDERVILGGANHGAVVWRLDGEALAHLPRRDCLLRLADGSGRFLGSKGGAITLYGPDLQPLQSAQVPIPYGVACLAHGGQRVIWSSNAGTNPMGVWDLETDEVWTLSGDREIDAVTFALSPCGRWLLTQQPYKHYETVCLWDLDARAVVAEAPSPKWAAAIAFTPALDGFFVAWSDGVACFDMAGAEQARFSAPAPSEATLPVGSARFRADGRPLTAAAGDRRPRTWKPDGSGWRQLRFGCDHAHAAIPSPDGKRGAVLCGARVRIAELDV